MKRKMNLEKATAKLFLSNGTISVMSFFALIYFTREIPSGELGSFFLLQALLGMLSIPATIGILGAVEKRISEEDAPGEVLTTAGLLLAVPHTVVVVAIVLLRPQIDAYLGANLALWLIVGLVLRTAKEFAIKVLRGELRAGETASLQFVVKASWAGLGGVLVALGFGVDGVIYGLYTGYVIAALWGAVKCSLSPGLPSLATARLLFDFAKFNFVSSTGSTVYSWMDVTMLGFFVSPALVSAYEVAWRVSAMLMTFSKAVATSLYPQVSAWDVKDERDRIEATLPKAMVAGIVFVVPAFFGIAILGEEILRFVFTPKYSVAWLALIILSGERMFHSLHMVLGRTLNGIDHPRLAAQAMVISLFLNFGLNLVLIWQFGIIGAAVATGVSFTANTALHARYLSQFITVRLPTQRIGWILIASLIMAAVVAIVKIVMPITSLTALAGAIAVGVMSYGMVLVVNRTLRGEIRETVRRSLI